MCVCLSAVFLILYLGSCLVDSTQVANMCVCVCVCVCLCVCMVDGELSPSVQRCRY